MLKFLSISTKVFIFLGVFLCGTFFVSPTAFAVYGDIEISAGDFLPGLPWQGRSMDLQVPIKLVRVDWGAVQNIKLYSRRWLTTDGRTKLDWVLLANIDRCSGGTYPGSDYCISHDDQSGQGGITTNGYTTWEVCYPSGKCFSRQIPAFGQTFYADPYEIPGIYEFAVAMSGYGWGGSPTSCDSRYDTCDLNASGYSPYNIVLYNPHARTVRIRVFDATDGCDPDHSDDSPLIDPVTGGRIVGPDTTMNVYTWYLAENGGEGYYSATRENPNSVIDEFTVYIRGDETRPRLHSLWMWDPELSPGVELTPVGVEPSGSWVPNDIEGDPIRLNTWLGELAGKPLYGFAVPGSYSSYNLDNDIYLHLCYSIGGGNQRPTATLSVNSTLLDPGETLNLTAVGNDSDNNLTAVSLKSRQCYDGVACTNASSWSTIKSDGFSERSSYTLTDFWTPSIADAGTTWQFYVNAYDSADAVCTGNPAYTAGRCDFSGNDNITVSVAPMPVIHGNIFNAENGCDWDKTSNTDFGSESPLQGGTNPTKVIWYRTAAGANTSVTSGTNSSYSISSPSMTEQIYQVGITNTKSIPGKVLKAVCARHPSEHPLSMSATEGSLFFTNANFDSYTLTSNLWLHLGYVLEDVKYYWHTSIDGDVYNTNGITITVPETTPPNYSGYYLDNKDYNQFGFIAGDLDVEDETGSRRAVESGSGYLENYSANFRNIDLDNIFSSADIDDMTLLDKKDDFANLESKIYAMDANKFKDVVKADFSYSVQDGKTALIFVLGDPSNTIKFAGKITSNNGNIVFIISKSPVEIDKSLGSDVPNPDDPEIDALIIASEDITFETNGASESDVAVVVRGGVISTAGSLELNRQGDAAANGYPMETVVYSPDYLYNLTKEVRESAQIYDALFLVNVEFEE